MIVWLSWRLVAQYLREVRQLQAVGMAINVVYILFRFVMAKAKVFFSLLCFEVFFRTCILTPSFRLPLLWHRLKPRLTICINIHDRWAAACAKRRRDWRRPTCRHKYRVSAESSRRRWSCCHRYRRHARQRLAEPSGDAAPQTSPTVVASVPKLRRCPAPDAQSGSAKWSCNESKWRMVVV